jgi:ElaA protein
MNNTIWKTITFNELTTHDLYTILQLRQKVFIVEQNCFYLDCDEKDFGCLHLCGYQNETMIAYLRIAPPGVIYKEVSIGRVLTEKSIRATGLGKELMKKALEICDKKFKNQTIKIMAQSYLVKFYEELGFHNISESFMEDGIPHNYMVRK